MSEARPNSQVKTVFAFGEIPAFENGNYVFKFFVSGGAVKLAEIAPDRICAAIAQIQNALADGECFFTAPDGARYAIAENLLRSLGDALSELPHDDSGGRGAHVAAESRAGNQMPAEPRACAGKTKAPAPAQNRGARQFINRQRLRRAESGKSPAAAKAEFSAEGTRAAECPLAKNNGDRRVAVAPKSRAPENGARGAPNFAPRVKTRNGRVSVVVGRAPEQTKTQIKE